jgi:HK97 family phage portal protein
MPQRLSFLNGLATRIGGFASGVRAPVAPIGSEPGWHPLDARGPGCIEESFTGAWQRNLSQCDDASMLGFSAVYACIAIISSDIAKMPLRLMRRRADGGRDVATTHPISALLYAPNHYQTRVDFIQQVMVSTLIHGNAYILKERDNREVVSSMYVLDPRRVKVLVAEETGDVFYEIRGSRLAGLQDKTVKVPASEMIHHRLVCLEHPLVGNTPLYAAGSSAMVGARIVMNSGSFFGHQARPAGALVAPGKIDKDTAKFLKDQWEENFSGRNTGRTAVLSNGLKWEPLTMTSVDAQLIEQLRWTVEDVARVYRVPSFMLGDLTKVTYKNSEQLNRTYYSGCLQYHIEALEARFDEAFGLATDVEIEFDLDTLFRTDMETRFAAYNTAINAGLMAFNEARAREDLPRLKGGDEPLVQKQNVPLSMVGKIAEQDTKPAPAPAPANDQPPAASDQAPSDASGDAAAPVNESVSEVVYASALRSFDQAIANAYLETSECET